MDPNDIFSLAQQAGVVDPFSPDTPAYADQFNFPPANSPAFTDEDILAHFVPQSEGPALFQDEESPILTPPEAPQGFAPHSLLSVGEKQSASASTSGFSPTKNQQVRRGPGARLDAEIAGIKAEGEAAKERQAVPFTQAVAGEQAAAEAEAQATANLITAEGHQKAILAKLQQDYDSRTEELIATEHSKAAETKAKYLAALNDFRAARVNPAQLWDNMTGGEQFGMLVTAFVQDFLGAGGIQTSAMATFNRAIDRNIDAQIRAIQQKGQVAEAFKTLWEMQMAESSSIQEARLRMRGFMIDSFKTATEAHLAQFNAALATAKGRAAIAKLDTELVKTLNDISRQIDQTTTQRITQAIQRYGEELRASMEAARIAVAREQNDIEREKLLLQQGAIDPRQGLVYDTSESGKGQARWVIRPDLIDKEGNLKEPAVKFLEDTAKVDHIGRLAREYQSLYRKYKNQSPLGGTRWSDTDSARLRNIAQELTFLRAQKVSGLTVTDTQLKLLSTGSPEAVFGTQYDVGRVLADTEKRLRDEWKAKRQQFAIELPKDDPRRALSAGQSTLGEAERAEAEAVGSGEAQRKSPEQLFRDNQIKDLEKHNAFSPIEHQKEVGSDVRKDHERFVEANPDLFPEKTKTTRFRGENFETKVKDTDIKKYERGLSRIKGQALRGRELAAESKDAEEQQQGQALYEENVEILKFAAGSVLTGANPNDPIGRYALQMLRDLGEPVDIAGVEQPQLEGNMTVQEEIDPRILPPIPESKRKK